MQTGNNLALYLLKQSAPHDPPGADYDEEQTRQNLQLRISQEAPRSNMKTSFEPGAGNRLPVAASFTCVFHYSIPIQESKKNHHSD